MQVCDADQSLGDTQGGKERKKEGENTYTGSVCVCITTEGVRPVKREGSDQRRDEAMEEARGRNREEWEVQSEPQGLCTDSNFTVLCTIFMGMFFFHDLFPLFARQMHAHTRPHTHKQTVTTFHAGFASAGQGKRHSHKRCGHTAPNSFALLCRP